MEETLHKRGIGKNTSREIVCLSGIANSSKNLLFGHIFDPKLCVFSSSDKFQTSINR